ncbi:MAG: hypothetical protein IKU06_04465 [Lachnospiraceae bacterium]|nr:hypothetical protein [Lachnospiraceae bacterium]
MTGSYTEASVKRKADVSTYLAKIGVVLLIGILFTFGFLAGQKILAFLAIGLGCLCWFVLFPKLDAEYEYIYCDGQIDFDRISGGESRKTVLRIDLDNVEIMAPEKSHELDKYGDSGLKIRDFSSHVAEAKKYCIITSDESNRLKVLFEPSEKMIELAKAKAPRKVFTE